jgi:hypothetical protein
MSNRILNSLLLSTIYFGLTSCGSDTPTDAPEVIRFYGEGIYSGYFTENENSSDDFLAIIDGNGAISAITLSNVTVMDGWLKDKGNFEATGVAQGFASPGYYFKESGSSIIDYGLSTKTAVDGSLMGVGRYQGVVINSFTLKSLAGVYSSPPSSFDIVAGSYEARINDDLVSMTIDANGGLSGRDYSGCVYQGALSRVENLLNNYSVSFKLSSCGNYNETYNGKAFFILKNGLPPSLVLISHGIRYGIGGVFVKK